MKKANRKILAVVAAVSLAGLASVQANTIAYTNSTGWLNMAPLAPTSLYFPQFDSALGQLNSVTLSLYGEQQAHVTAENGNTNADWLYVGLAGGSGDYIHAAAPGASLNVTLTGPLDAFHAEGNDDPVNPDTGKLAYDGAGADFHDFGTVAASWTDGTTLTTSLTPYVGAGTFQVDVTGDGGWILAGPPAAQLTTTAYQGAGTVMIEYSYTVPEPATLVLLVPACALIVRWRRSRKAKRA